MTPSLFVMMSFPKKRSANTRPMIGKMTTTLIAIMMNQTMTIAVGRHRTTEIWTGEEKLSLENV